MEQFCIRSKLGATTSVMGQSRRLSDVGMSALPPDFGRMVATQRTDALGQKATSGEFIQ
jgi:hypothetical protein